MGTPLGPKCIPYTYMDPLGRVLPSGFGAWVFVLGRVCLLRFCGLYLGGCKVGTMMLGALEAV